MEARRVKERVAAGSAVLSALMVPATTSLRFTRGPHRPRAIGRNQEHCEAEMPPCYRIFNHGGSIRFDGHSPGAWRLLECHLYKLWPELISGQDSCIANNCP